MATLGQSGKVTLLDIAKATGPDSRIAQVAELLTQTNEILLDMPWFEGNLATGHKGVVRTGLPTAVWRSMYQGVPPSKSTRAQVEDACGMLETRSEVDIDIAKLNGNTAEFRLSEATAFVESMNQTMAQTVIYGNQGTNPEQFNGLAIRYSTISGATNAVNVIDAGGTGSDNTSMYLVVWGRNTVHGIYPKGSTAGLQHEDLGVIDAFDGNQNRFRAYADWWQWKCGMHVKDWRYVVRIANIDVSNLVTETGAADLVKLVVRAFARIPFAGMGTPVLYANRTVKEMLSIQALNKSQNAMSITESLRQFGGVNVAVQDLKVLGVPLRTVDRILTTEARVV
jgi:hypothetical protein